MAPDLNAVSSSRRERWDYSTPGSSGYEIPDIAFNDPSSRKLRVITIGAGFSGIMMAYQIQKDMENVEHVVYDKNADIGGTWLENRYPGCACDIPSHAYTYSFALNPDWPRFFSYAPDIWKYLDKVCEVFELRQYMTFNTRVTSLTWQEDRGQWKVGLEQSVPGQKEPRVYEDYCDWLNYATGILNNYKWPDLQGLDSFKGRVVHTALWPEDYPKEQWASERVAVIGSGASSIQTVPNMQPHTKHLDVFIRTPVWFTQIANNFGANHEYSKEDREKFRNHPHTLVEHAKDIENQVNSLFEAFYSGSAAQEEAQRSMSARMREWIQDDRLLEGFTPKFELGCRRITPGDPYMLAIQEPNVDVHFTGVDKVTEDGLVGADGVERKADTIICATGFDVTYKPRFPITGRNGVDLYEKWKDAPEAYIGATIPDMPNFIMFIGPTWPVENGSVAGPLQSVAHYTIQALKKMQREHVKSMAPRQDITDQFNAHAQEWYKHTVWKDSCRSWYKNNETGRINAVWPGSALQYMELLKYPRWQDYEIRYQHSNPWAALGMGCMPVEKRHDDPKRDLSPNIQEENNDPKWLNAMLQGEEVYPPAGTLIASQDLRPKARQ